MKSKKLLLTLGFMGLLMAGCKTDKTERTLSILVPTGAPAICFYNYSDNKDFKTNSDPQIIKSSMASGVANVVVLPTDFGIKAIREAGLNFKIAATITFGNLFVASTGNDSVENGGDGVMGNDDYVVAFQEQGVPGKLFKYVYGNVVENPHFVSDVTIAKSILATGKDETSPDKPNVDYVLMAEPAYTVTASQVQGRSIYANVQIDYLAKSGGLEMFQASIFIKDSLDRGVADEFLVKIKKDIEDGLANPSLIEEGMNKISNGATVYGVGPAVAKTLTLNGNRMGIGYKVAKENKTAIDSFLNVLNVGGTNEEIYY